jgi:hypothetical protein
MSDRGDSAVSTPIEGGYVPDDPDATIRENGHELAYRPLEVNGRLVQGQLVCTRCKHVRTALRWFAENDCRSVDTAQHTLSVFE